MGKLLLLVSMSVLTLTGCTAAWSPLTGMMNEEPAAETVLGDAVHGEMIYRQGEDGAPACISCHALEEGKYSLGPVMRGISGRAGSRISGLDAGAYIRQSILEPEAYLVSGYRSMMYPQYAEHFDEQDITDLLAYLGGL